MKNSIVGLKELRENLEDYIVKIKRGNSFLVVRRSKPVFKISPPADEEGFWESVVDFTKIKKDGVSAKVILRELRKLNA